MDIRKLEVKDADELKELRLKSLVEDPDPFIRTYEEELKKPADFYQKNLQSEWAQAENFVLGAFENGRLVGHAGFQREVRQKIMHKGTLWGMYVLPEYRGRGIGKLLVSELIKLVKNLEVIEQINLVVVSNNISAKKLYSSFGFETFGTEKNAIKINDRYLDEDFMALKL